MKPIIVDFDAVRTREQFLTDGFKIKYSLAIRPSHAGRWDSIKIESTGMREYVTGPEDGLRDIVNPKTGQAFTTEVYLNAAGTWAGPASFEPDFIPYAIPFRVLDSVDFSPLRLPDLTQVIYDNRTTI